MNLQRSTTILLAASLLSARASTVRAKSEFIEGVKSPPGIQVEAYAEKPAAEIDQRIESLVEKPLTVDGAIQIAALNNRRFQATLQELGIAKGDLIQLALPRNPELSAGIGFPTSGNAKSHITVDLTQDITSLLLSRRRKKIGALQYQQTTARVSTDVLTLATDVKISYYELQSLMQTQSMLQGVVEASEASLDLSERQLKAGTISELEYANQHAVFDQAKLDLIQAETSLQNERERMNRLLGLNRSAWTLESSLPDPPEADLSHEEAEHLAISQRTDLDAARNRVLALEQSLKLARIEAIPSIELGVEAERNEEGTREVGPLLRVGLPVFNRNQGIILRTKSELAQSWHLVAALDFEVRSEVRAAMARMASAGKAARYYRDTIIPVRTKIVEESQKHYNYMLVGVYQLVLARQNEIAARRAYIEAVKDYWTARSELERAVGGTLPDSFTDKKARMSANESTEQPSKSQNEDMKEMPMTPHMYHSGDH